jgi:hypothetical protein
MPLMVLDEGAPRRSLVIADESGAANAQGSDRFGEIKPQKQRLTGRPRPR